MPHKPDRLRYVDTEDKAWQIKMQEPETQDHIRNAFLDIPPEDWPDQIWLADLPQVPDTEVDAPIEIIIGRCEGHVQNRGDVVIDTTTDTTIFKRPKSTKFVRVVRLGVELMERWNAETHGEWEKIPDTELTPSQLIEYLYGFGDTETEQGQQFSNVRKKRASTTQWKPGHHPLPQEIKHS